MFLLQRMMKSGMIVLAAVTISCLCGCAVFDSSESPFGSVVVEGGSGGNTLFEGDTVDVSSGENVASDRERLPVFVTKPIVAPATLARIENFDSASFTDLVQRSTEEALSAFGRFAVVVDQDKALILVEPRVLSAIPWSDTVTKDDGFDFSDLSGAFVNGSETINVEREGVDVCISLSFRRSSDLASIANERATGRLSMNRGEVYRGINVSSDRGSSNMSGFQKLDQAEIDEARLTEIVNDTVRGVIVIMLNQFDGSWWLPTPNTNGIRPISIAGIDG